MKFAWINDYLPGLLLNVVDSGGAYGSKYLLADR